jgi:hypothetical protein
MSETVNFGDFDPEDAYDVGDSPEIRLTVIRKVINDLRALRADPRFENRRADMRRVIADFLNEHHPDFQTELEDLRDDLEAL